MTDSPVVGRTRMVLASASPARLSVLRSAGIEPLVRVSGVDEDALTAALGPATPSDVVVTELASAKAESVAAEFVDQHGDLVVIGCDSMLSIGGELHGKPHTVELARERWRSMAGNSGVLLTGHAVLRMTDGAVVGRAKAHSATVVHFARPSAVDLEAYLASGEPLSVAGAFTLDGLGGWFVDRIEGDPSSVIGLGLPLVRVLLDRVGTSLAALWAADR